MIQNNLWVHSNIKEKDRKISSLQEECRQIDVEGMRELGNHYFIISSVKSLFRQGLSVDAKVTGQMFLIAMGSKHHPTHKLFIDYKKEQITL